jgi:oligoendopeptidase F
MSEIKARDEIKEEYKWDLTTIFKDEKEFLSFYEETKKLIEEYPKYQNHVMDNASTFYEALTKSYEISRRLDKLYSYAHMISDQDVSHNKNQERVGKVLNLYDIATKNTYFLSTEMLHEDYSKIESFYEEKKELLDYKKDIEDTYKYKAHTLSDEEEKLLSNLGKALGQDEQTYSLLTDSDLKFGTILDENNEEKELTDTNYSIFIESKDRRVRKDAFQKLYEVYKQFQNSITSTLDGHIKENVTLSHIRNYQSAFDRSLFKDDLDEDVYNTLVETVHENLDTFQKYYELKKEVLGLDEIHLYDVYVDLIKEYNKKYPFEEAKDIVFKAIKVLGEEYSKDLEKAFQEGWIDIYPNKNKRGGAYSGGCYDTNPFVLLNYQGKLNDVSTLIHELGHSMHSYYTRHNQPYQYGDYPIFVAEVASTTNELILARYLIENSKDNDEKLAALNHLLELFKGTIFRQTMFEEFEQYAYNIVEQDDVISAEKLCDKYYELNKLYFGENVVCDDEIRYEWEKVPHFFYNFYVYKYATSLSAACDIATRILNGDKEALSSYLEMLKSGSTKTPLDTLKIAGVDMTDKKVYESAIHMFDETIDEFKKVYKKTK